MVREVITQTGVLAGKRRRALDSTVLDDAVARQDTVTQLIAAIRRVAREVPGAAELVVERCTRLAGLTGQDYSQTGKPPIAWDDPAARDELVSALVGDALALLDGLDLDAIEAEGGKPAEAVALLALVAGQDVEPADGSDGTDGRWRIARRIAPDRVISTVDPDARHAHKTREQNRDGFKAHVVVEPDTGLVTEVRLTKTAGPDNSDAAVGADLVGADPTIDEQAGQVEVLGDSAYGTGDMLATLDKREWTPVLKPWPLRPAVPGGFTIDDFTHDTAAGTLTCPSGVTRTLTTKRTATFGAACRGCPLAGRCTTSTRGRKIRLHEHDAAAARPPGAGRRRDVPGHLPHPPAHGRTHHRLAHPPQPARALPRGRQERRLAAPPRRRAQPAPAARPRPHPPRRGLAAGLTSTAGPLQAVPAPHQGRAERPPTATHRRSDTRAGQPRRAPEASSSVRSHPPPEGSPPARPCSAGS